MWYNDRIRVLFSFGHFGVVTGESIESGQLRLYVKVVGSLML